MHMWLNIRLENRKLNSMHMKNTNDGQIVKFVTH